MVERITPPDEVERINERLFRQNRLQIQDRDSYDLAFGDLFQLKLTNKQKKLREDAFDEYIQQHPEVTKERLFTKAKGKDLRKDRKTTAKVVVETREEFIEETAPKVDLRGFDTARQKISKKIKRRREFTIPARVKGRIIRARKTFVVVKGKRQVRFRDVKGRFVSGKPK